MTATSAALCPGCFADKGTNSTCPRCGYDESLKRGPLVLAHRTLLNHGQYLIGKVLGKPGGFGITYLALDTKLETRVAIKEYLPRDLAGRDAGHATISAHSAEDGEFFRYGLTQFLQEARTLAQFDHANIVRVRNFFEENGTGYLVMDYYDGVTLADYLAQQPQGRLPEKTAVGILMPILDGLREVHAKNFLHRDIKPQNIYLTTGNRPILLDFGAARQAMSERSRSLSVVLSEGYAPYEQYHRRGEQGPWTDIYACAAVLYHTVAGEAPPPATERMHKDELDIATLGLSASLTNALRLGLAADHHNRPQRMTEFQALLLGSAAQIPATSAEPKPAKTPASEVPRTSAQPKSSIKTWVLAALGGTVIAVIALGSLRQQQPELASSPTQTVQPVAQIPPALVQPVSQPEPLTKQKTEKDATELKIDTRFGAFKIVSGKSEEGCNNDILLFRERTTGLGNYCGLSFLAVYAIRDMDVLLLSDSSSNPRNGEDFAQVVLLTVKSDGQVRQISSPQHFSGSDESEPMPKLVDGHVVVDLGFEDGQRKKAVFNGETLTFTLENPNSKEIFPIPSKDCGELFHLVTRYCVGLDSCVIPTEGLNVFSMDYRKKHHPAIKTPRFSDVCTTVCNKGRAPSGADFKLQFCGVS